MQSFSLLNEMSLLLILNETPNMQYWKSAKGKFKPASIKTV